MTNGSGSAPVVRIRAEHVFDGRGYGPGLRPRLRRLSGRPIRHAGQSQPGKHSDRAVGAIVSFGLFVGLLIGQPASALRRVYRHLAGASLYDMIGIWIAASIGGCSQRIPKGIYQWKTTLSTNLYKKRGSGESIQLHFQGDGWVVLQPYEEVYAEVGQG